IYGLVCRADNQPAVRRLLDLKHRDNRHPPVIIVGSLDNLKILGIELNEGQQEIAAKLWPGPFSLILPCPDKKFDYLHGGLLSLAVRLPQVKWLTDLIKETGPLATSSANVHKQDSATTIDQAKQYFTDKVDFYVDAGELVNNPSTIISLLNDEIKILRQGAGQVPEGLLKQN
ncbi:MAG: L-threonylcarbamoyladenylate synthase, partial [bacterium]